MKDQFDKLGIETICVFREEKDGVKGAAKAAKESNFSPILIDTPTQQTKAYSQEDFATYLISKDGVVKAELTGTKKVRPTAKEILDKAKEVF